MIVYRYDFPTREDIEFKYRGVNYNKECRGYRVKRTTRYSCSLRDKLPCTNKATLAQTINQGQSVNIA